MAGQSKRGFAAMSPQEQREIARRGGQAAHKKGTAHEFTPEEARIAGQRGGKAISRDRQHMAMIGRRGGQSSGRRTGKPSQENAMREGNAPNTGEALSAPTNLSATMLLRTDHDKVNTLFSQYEALNERSEGKENLVKQICQELDVHAHIEEEIFYPAVRAALGEEANSLLNEAVNEHQIVKDLVAQLEQYDFTNSSPDDLVHQLRESVLHHVQEEERDMLPRAEAQMNEQLGSLGARLQQRKQELLANEDASMAPQAEEQPSAPQAQATQGDGRNGSVTNQTEPVNQETQQEQKQMSTIEKSIDVNVPVHTAYNQWTQFEEFPRFMEGVQAVRQLDDKRLQWRANIGGKEKEWEAKITEQVPDQRIAWRNTTGATNAGVVTFHRISDNQTRVMLQMDYDPEGFTENVGDMLGVVSARIRGDLERFKEFIESRGQETGAWRGEIHQPAK